MPATFTLRPTLETNGSTLLIIGKRDQLLAPATQKLLPKEVTPPIWSDMVKRNDPGDSGTVAETYTGSNPKRVVAGVVPAKHSRHNAASHPVAIAHIVQRTGLKG
ncbi:MAG: hypothetical protein HN348_08260, partial [Proteobacteria bacterium]|nr:hypothetical protein [Pseudomonadota bacterium]